VLVRSERLLNRRVQAASFREQRTLDQFDWSFNLIFRDPDYVATPGR
jgi:hypothetical protein